MPDMTHERIAALLGIACVALAVARSVLTFPTAIVSVVLVGIVVFEARLYSDALLQLFFVAANLYGWSRWRASQRQVGEVVVRRMAALRSWLLVWTAAATILWGAAMHGLTDAAHPWWDAGDAASVAAQVLMARGRIENWVLWIAVDLASIPLYLVKGLTMLAGLYVDLALAIAGLVQWYGVERRVAMRAVPA
ncbi:nicotinamide riboside transporter PnuC [Sphingomonas sp. MMS24-JH45]